MKIQLAIFGSDVGVKDFIISDVKRVLDDVVEIYGFSATSMLQANYDFPVVLTTHHYYAEEAKRYFPHSKIIPGRKMINGYNLEKLFLLPKNKEVLVVCHPRMATEEVISNLYGLGIDHLKYVPYWIGNEEVQLDGIDTAVSPGMGNICPPEIKNIIDVGYRIFSIFSFYELLINLGLSMEYLEKYVNYYNYLLMNSSKQIAGVLKQSELFRKEQEIILDQIDEGIISTNKYGKIALVNPVIEKIIGVKAQKLLDKNIWNVLTELGLNEAKLDELKNNHQSDGLLLNIHNRKILCDIRSVVIDDDEEKRLIFAFKEAEKIQILEQKMRRELFKKGYVAKYTVDDIWGTHRAIKSVIEKALNFAGTELTVLITGESGTGKELFAQAIHLNSARKAGPFLAINFAAIPETLVESELFGYERGAFTGARKEGKAGIFEQAHGGTIFLDEIGDAPLHIQARLLRVLQEKEIMRIGGSSVIPINVRFIAATNIDLFESVKKRRFRTDLYYRLNALPIKIPALRERKEDVAIILDKYFQTQYGAVKVFSSDLMQFLHHYDWPGNVRELLNVADYIYYTSKTGEKVCYEDIPDYLTRKVIDGLNPLNKSVVQELLDQLADEGKIEDILLLLEILTKYDHKNKVGRNKLLAELALKNLPITEHKLKKYLSVLNTLRLINTGRTKQGTSITDLGEEVFGYMKNAYHR